MSVFFTHIRIRLLKSLADPFTLLVLLFSALMTLFYWPGLVGPSGTGGAFWFGLRSLASMNGPEDLLPVPALGLCIMLLWIYIWPMMAGNVVAGPVTGGRTEAMILRPHPALPIGTRTRVVAEALLVLGIILIIRIPFIYLGEWAHGLFHAKGPFMGQPAFKAHFLEHTLQGSLIMLPTLLAWIAPASHLLVYWIRPLVLTCLLYVAIECGMLDSLPASIITSIVLSTACLFTVGREVRLPALWKRERGAPESRYRAGRDPESTLRRDQWSRPTSTMGIFLAIEAGLMLCDQLIGFPGYVFYLSSSLVFGFMLSFVVMRPLGSNLIAAGISGRGGIRPGDFRAAWSVLPVRIESVLRGVYAHGLIVGLFIWTIVIGINLFDTWFETGQLRMQDPDGDSAAKYLLPFIAAVPPVAGLLTCTAVGDRVRGMVSLGAGIGILVGHHLCLILDIPVVLHTVILIFLAVLGGIPPLVHLRRPRAPASCDQSVEGSPST